MCITVLLSLKSPAAFTDGTHETICCTNVMTKEAGLDLCQMAKRMYNVQDGQAPLGVLET